MCVCVCAYVHVCFTVFIFLRGQEWLQCLNDLHFTDLSVNGTVIILLTHAEVKQNVFSHSFA